MTIQWYGEGCFKIQSGGTTIMTDPVDSKSGLTAPRFKADIVIYTSLDPDTLSNGDQLKDKDGNKIILGPGEYEIAGVPIRGWALKKNGGDKKLTSIFKIKLEDMTLGLLDGMASFSDPEIIEELGDIDILFVPAGGPPLLEQKTAAKIVRQIEPRLVIPTHFKVKGLKRRADGPQALLKELGINNINPEEKLSIKRKDLSEKMQAVVLKI